MFIFEQNATGASRFDWSERDRIEKIKNISKSRLWKPSLINSDDIDSDYRQALLYWLAWEVSAICLTCK